MSRKKKMTLFYTMKINTSDIINNNYYIKSNFDLLRKNGKIISLGDNQLLRFIRRIKGVDFNQEEIVELFKKKKELQLSDKSKKNSKKICDIQNIINEKLFVPDLVSVKCDTTRKDYKDICKNEFILDVSINDKSYTIKYKRLCAGAGQLRRNTAMFVNEDLYDLLYAIMMCGLTKERIGKINLAKFNAYFSLYSSATNKVRTPRICVVKDYEYILKNQNVVWINRESDNSFNTENKCIDMEINVFDGAGMISPDMALKWQEDLTLDYLPSSFIIRAPFIKGLVSIFDFKEFAKEIAHKEFIKDVYGVEYNINDIDVILTSSQFKMYKKYQNFQEYMYFFKKYNHIFGVTRVTKKENDFMTTLNYQYIQTNNFTEESIKNLANYTVDYLKKVMSGDKLFALLLMLGKQDIGSSAQEIEDNTDSSIAKALMYNDTIINDSYIRNKISKMIDKKVKQAKIGKIYVEGSYDFAIPDLYAMAEHAFGLDVKGLLSAGECWNKRWVDKNSKVVTLMRSPLVTPGENRKLNICFDDKCKEWFKYIYSGNIYNIWDTTIIAQSDADFDGDIILTSDNKYLIDAVDGSLPIVTYEKQKAKEQRVNPTNFAAMDVKSFDTKIGSITNLASSLISMLSEFPQDSEEYKEIRKRIDLLRFFQGNEIDKTKGIVSIPPPSYWNKKQKYISVSEDCTDEEIEKITKQNEKIFFNNRICACTKPYFFGYVYDREMKKYKEYKKDFNRSAEDFFGKKLSDILNNPNCTDKEKELKNNYYKYMPLKRNNSIMNTLTYYVEDMEFDNKWKKKSENFDYRVLMKDESYIPTNSNIKSLKEKAKCFFKEYQNITIMESQFESFSGDEYQYENTYKYLYELFSKDIYSVISNEEELCDCMIYILYNYFKTYSKDILWNLFGEQIVKNLKCKTDKFCYVCESEDGTEYLGKRYKLVEVNIDAVIV